MNREPGPPEDRGLAGFLPGMGPLFLLTALAFS